MVFVVIQERVFNLYVKTFGNSYTLDIGLGGSHSHNFELMNLQKLVHFDGVFSINDVKGGTIVAIYQQLDDCGNHGILIDADMNNTRWM